MRRNTDDKFVSILFPSTGFGERDLRRCAIFAILVCISHLEYKGEFEKGTQERKEALEPRKEKQEGKPIEPSLEELVVDLAGHLLPCCWWLLPEALSEAARDGHQACV